MTDGATPLVRRGRRNARYTAISNDIIDHPTLSPDARIALIYLLSKPDDWKLQINDIRRLLGTGGKICGRNKAYEVLKELKASAYVVAFEEVLKGRFHRLTYYVFDEPHADPDGFRSELRRDAGGPAAVPRVGGNSESVPDSPRPGIRETVTTTCPEKPHPENGHATKEGKKQNTDLPPLSPTQSNRARQGGVGGDLEFSRFWNEWPERARPRDRSCAQKLFLGLATDDRRRAAGHAASYRATQNQRGDFAAMIFYLRDRLFLEFEDGPAIDRDGYFVITSVRPEWEAWLNHYRGRYRDTVLAPSVQRGFLLTRTRWPTEGGGPLPTQTDNLMPGAASIERSDRPQGRSTFGS